MKDKNKDTDRFGWLEGIVEWIKLILDFFK